jgi:cell wall-associated NlpC family hydrolase
MRNAQIVEEARSMIGTKFRHGGRSRISVDCAGLVAVVAQSLGFEFSDEPRYSRIPRNGELKKHLDRTFIQDGKNISLGSVLLFWMDPNTEEPQHVAIASEKGKMIHAYAPSRKVVEVDVESYWLRRLCCSYRWPGAH